MSQNLSDKLYTIRFKCDDVSHLTIKETDVCVDCTTKDCNFFCPADVYDWDPSQKITTVAYENCIECGTCRIACPAYNIEWVYPQGGYGMSYKLG
ncbi:ferredoxin like protein [Thermoactinomyces sp. DSM 45891]|uniref:Ferredoxin-like protein n=1 Tax=Baia soyae TaxID=1544746 RepID=A0A4R2RZP1_9BACL|nr:MULTISPECIES: 4Fe-4S dicluster domain-containing protein [Thermoactinomycetaceae]TCP68599.1 ferredoxin like protein [Baia soyae]SDY04832.1 ferredoxin like protein [Thermoactinomyces sp. DSM 45892]SFX09343.1 ferredoxin like protein [Thermoactinomyces sp. DSM 45891]